MQAVKFQLLLEVGVVLCDTEESELLHQVLQNGVFEVLVLEGFDGQGESRGEEHDLTLQRQEGDDVLQNRLEVLR